MNYYKNVGGYEIAMMVGAYTEAAKPLVQMRLGEGRGATIEKDVCYGQTDVPIDAGVFESSVKNTLSQLPEKVDAIYSSPLMRCSYLANYVKENKYSKNTIEFSELLKEVNFGDWENKKWNDINQTEWQE